MTPFATVGGATLYHGDARAVLRGLPEGGVQCILTSPPYWSQRRYQDSLGEQEQVWGGREGCEHSWTEDSFLRRSNDNKGEDTKQSTNLGSIGRDVPVRYAYCQKCGAWRGCLGLEPSPEQYVSNLVSVFREVWRVLHPTGVLLVNLGDGYAGGGRGGKPAESD